MYLHEIVKLTDADIARATGVARSTARAWLAHTRSPTGERAERLIELSALVERLARVMEPSYIAGSCLMGTRRCLRTPTGRFRSSR